MGEYSFLLLAFCLTFTASQRPFITLCIISQFAYYGSIEGFVLLDYLAWMGKAPTTYILFALAAAEIIFDTRSSAISTTLHLTRPLACVASIFAVMRFPWPFTNAIVAIMFSLSIGMAFTRLINSIIVPYRYHKIEKTLANRNAKIKDDEIVGRVSNTLPISLLQDAICVILAFSAFYATPVAVIAIVVLVIALVVLQQRMRSKQPVVEVRKKTNTALLATMSPESKLPKFNLSRPSKEQNLTIADLSIFTSDDEFLDKLTSLEKENELNGYGYL